MQAGITDRDLELLERAAGSPPAAVRDELVSLQRRSTVLLDALAESVVGESATAALWPLVAADATHPFLWGRIKQAEATRFATHLGIFISPEHSNVCIDLEKDLIDAGDARESVDQVHEFFRERLRQALPQDVTGLQVWTDPDNVLSIDEFLATDFSEFMRASGDPGHPWPKLGEILDRDAVTGDGAAWLRTMERRLRALVPVYRSMLRSWT